MITLAEVIEMVDWIESHPVIGAAIIGSIGYTIVGMTKLVYKKLTETSVQVSPTFWTLGKKYRIDAVHKYEPSDDVSGYKQYQHSRPDQWKKLIEVKSILNLRHTIIPINKDDVLVVCISRDGRENGKVIYFNR